MSKSRCGSGSAPPGLKTSALAADVGFMEDLKLGAGFWQCGSFFFADGQKQMCLKRASNRELRTIIIILLPAYSKHVEPNPNTALQQWLGRRRRRGCSLAAAAARCRLQRARWREVYLALASGRGGGGERGGGGRHGRCWRAGGKCTLAARARRAQAVLARRFYGAGGAGGRGQARAGAAGGASVVGGKAWEPSRTQA